MLKLWWKSLLKSFTKYFRLTYEHNFEQYVVGNKILEALNPELIFDIEAGTY